MAERGKREQTKRLTLADVAEQAGVSSATVSLALNNSPLVRQTTRTRIVELANILGYTRHPTARRLATNRTDCLCVAFAAGTSDPFYWDIMCGIMETAERYGYRFSTSTPVMRTVANSPQLPVINPDDVDGILVLNWHDRYVVRHLLDYGLPIVLVDASGDHPDIPTVDNDDYAGIHMGVDHLVRLGHQRIGFVGTPLDAPFGRQTWQGYFNAMADANLHIQPRLVLTSDFTMEGGTIAAETLLSLEQPPTAIVTANDEMAIGVMRAAQRRGLRIPRDLAVVGMDDIAMAQLADPSLTTVRIDRYGLGQQATELLIRLIQGADDAMDRKITLTPQLVIRASCGAVAPVQS